MTFLWIAVFIVSLVILIRSAGWFLHSAENIGLALGLSPFIIGITIVSAGTSLPELVSSLFAIYSNASEIVAANAVGSNIANILFIGGLSATVGGGLLLRKKMLLIDIVLLLITTALGIYMIRDGSVSVSDAIILLVVYVGYIGYSIKFQNADSHKSKKRIIKKKDVIVLLVGIIGLAFGAKYLIDSVIKLSEILKVSPGVISLLAIAFGTSLPELIVSIKAVLKNKDDIVIGNIIGSNIFNILLVIGVPGTIRILNVDSATISPGIPMMTIATLLLFFVALYKKIPRWLGVLFFIGYVVFILQVSGVI